jgi:hypothetical protein
LRQRDHIAWYTSIFLVVELIQTPARLLCLRSSDVGITYVGMIAVTTRVFDICCMVKINVHGEIIERQLVSFSGNEYRPVSMRVALGLYWSRLS